MTVQPTFHKNYQDNYQVLFGRFYAGVVSKGSEGWSMSVREGVQAVPVSNVSPGPYPTRIAAVEARFGGHFREGAPIPGMLYLTFPKSDWHGDFATIQVLEDKSHSFLLYDNQPEFPGQDEFHLDAFEADGETYWKVYSREEQGHLFPVHRGYDGRYYASMLGIEREGSHPVEAAAKVLYSL